MSKSHSGFTLIEMMIAVVVICILVAVGFPSFKALLRSNRIATQTNTFLASVNLARSEAIRNNFNAGICASADGATCTTDWNAGWLVWDDTNNDGLLDNGERVVRTSRGTTDLSFATNPAGGPGILVFNNRGMYNGAQMSFRLQPVASDCPTGYAGLRNMTLFPVGQLVVTQAPCP